jgi:hypothetical protein
MTPTILPRILHCGDGLAMAEIGNVCVALWRSKSVRSRFEIQKAALDECVQRRPGKTAFMCVVEPTSEPPDEDVRKASSKMIADHGKDLRCTACVIEGAGFRGAITRSVLSGIVFLVRTPTPLKMFESVDSASRWIQTEMPDTAGAALASQVEYVRRKLDTNERVVWKRGISAGA